MDHWLEAQREELGFWGNCANTLGEEMKQLIYARYMSLNLFHDGSKGYNIDMQFNSILDIGGGPVSLLLKCINREYCVVVDPAKYPEWIYDRYEDNAILPMQIMAEDICNKKYTNLTSFDEVWIYNVLQHTVDPKKIIENAKKVGKTLRIFEWIDSETNTAHPHSLTRHQLEEWIGMPGNVSLFNGQNGCYGTAFYGVFNFNG